MNQILSVLAVMAITLHLGGALAHAHEDHEIDPELLASKIRERGHECAKVTRAQEKSENPTVIEVQCSGNNAYRVVITKSDFEVTRSPSLSAP